VAHRRFYYRRVYWYDRRLRVATSSISTCHSDCTRGSFNLSTRGLHRGRRGWRPMKSKALGVVVVRVQVPELHDGHRYLLDAVTNIHERVLVVIGTSEARLTTTDPLSYEIRRQMILKAYPDVQVDQLGDKPSDLQWSDALDGVIERWQQWYGEPYQQPVLYGGRDSFLSHYHGKNRIFELPPAEPMSGTDIRASVGVTDSTDFRRGIIYASKHRYPTSYQCVDAAIWNPFGQILLGQKKTDNGKWRFIGGFVNTTDPDLEYAVRREVREETGVESGDPEYIGSARIDSYRYRSGDDKLMSALFAVPFGFGPPKAADDLDEVGWFDWKDVKNVIADEHMPLYSLLEEWWNSATF